jgi:YNFM family putative membrane transporter
MNAPVLPPRGALQLRRADPGFARIAAAFFVGGFATFALLYAVQPLLPILAREFRQSPAGASVALSVTTLTMAFSLVLAGSASEVLGRKRIMIASLAASAIATLLSGLAPNFAALVALRALAGFALSGLPAVAMAYLADEIAPESLGLAMGLYIAGSTLGGMTGRVAVGLIADLYNWRIAVSSLGLTGLFGAVYFLFALPRERSFEPKPFEFRALIGSLLYHFADPGLRLLFAEGFLVMGAFVCTYNYIAFRLAAKPFELSATVTGLVYLTYVFGAVSSTVMGDLAGRYGRRRILWTASAIGVVGVVVSLPDWLPSAMLGLALVTWGFFGAHSVSSSWVGLRATNGRAQAAALYLFFYYLGSSAMGSAGGWFYSAWGWNGVALLVGGLVFLAFLVALKLAKVPPPVDWPKS